MKAIDIGVNLTDKQYNKDRKDVVDEAVRNDIGMIITGCTAYSNKAAIDFIRNNPKYNLKCTIGLHPHNANQYTEDFLIGYLDMLDKNRDIIVAIGEIGLDYDRMRSPKDIQIHTFMEMIDMAKKYKLPMFLHERDAVDDFYSILSANKELAQNSVVHCFTGNKDTVGKYLKLGCMIGITGWICDDRRNQDLIEAVKYIPLDRLMVETDGPYLTPRCLKTRRNVPSNLPYVWRKIAEVIGKEEDEVREVTLNNTIRFFNL